MKKIKHVLTTAGLVLSTSAVTLGILNVTNPGRTKYTASASVNMNPAYDLSEWQSSLTDAQVQKLKNEASFVIIRVQYGSNYADKVYQNNISLLNKYGVPYGVYSYSLYNSVAQAQGEAQTLYNRVPNAKFYVNDLEQTNGMSKSTLDAATSAWAAKMRTLTSSPVVLYSGLYFMNNTIGDSKNDYDTLWLASYGSGEPDPSYTYGLWQFTSSYYSKALNKSIDASVIPDGGKSMAFWTGSSSATTSSDDDDDDSVADSSQASSASSQSASSSVATSSAVSSSASSVSATSSASSSAASSSSATSVSSSTSTQSAAASTTNDDSSSDDDDAIFSDSSDNLGSSTAKKNDVSKKATKKQKVTTIKVMKPKINKSLYYSSKKIKRVKVTAKNGIYVYNSVNHRLKHYKKGQVLKVLSFKQQGTKTIAISNNGTHFTANKNYIKAVK
ncbi:GH25 family lysozyme [Nicoliella lavandulae]|uniref:GH25 family lysozyme n=1 Tax=Nicoliella lavandulae TaxID=3082954 RepID=A0ABU8SJF4_9LACO